MKSKCRAQAVRSFAILPLESRAMLDAALPFEAYFAEGFANSGIEETVTIANANDASVQYELLARYERGGRDQVLATGTIPAGQSIDQNISGTSGVAVRPNEPFAFVLRSSLATDATLRHVDFGNELNEHFTAQTSNEWSFPQCRRDDGNFMDFILVYNPLDNPATMTITLHGEDGSTTTATLTVDGQRRAGWSLKDIGGLRTGNYAVTVGSSAPFVAYESQYELHATAPHGFGILGFIGGGATAGFVAGLELENSFFHDRDDDRHPDRADQPRPDLFLSVFNGQPNAAHVTVTLVFANQAVAPLTRTITVSAGSLLGVSLADLTVAVGQEFGILYQSDQPVVMSANVFQRHSFVGVLAATFAATQWLLGASFMNTPAFGHGLHEDLFIFNPGATSVNVTIHTYRPNGDVNTLLRTVGPHEFQDVDFRNDHPGTNHDDHRPYIVTLSSVQPIVASFERHDAVRGVDFAVLGMPYGSIVSLANALHPVP